MTIKEIVKNIVEKVTGTTIYRTLPIGVDNFSDIALRLPNLALNSIFDVGANIGQSAINYHNLFPNSRIYCFEPVKETFKKLEKNLINHTQTTCYNIALGASKGEAQMVLEGSSDMFFLLNPSSSFSKKIESKLETVTIETIDEFCTNSKIDRISYLKIDTEGGDLEVLKGAKKMLNEQVIDLIEVEAAMNCKNERHVQFEHFKQYLESNKYYLFGIYEQVTEWPTSEPHLRRSNLVFISEKIIKLNRAIY